MLHVQESVGETLVESEKLRVLVLGDSRSFHIERYLPELRAQGCEVLLASLEPGKIEYFQLKWRGPVRQLHYRLAVPELKELISKFKPDIVDAHYASGYGHLAALALSELAIPLTVHLWGSDILIVPKKSILHKMKAVKALKSADAIVADSEYLLNEARNLAPLKQTMISPFGIEKKYLELHKKDYALARPLKIIVPRPHEPVYNNLFILNSLSLLVQDGRITLTFPDFGTLLDKFKFQVNVQNISGVNFYRRCEREEFLKLMLVHDVYLSASRSDSSPVSLIESMALGLIPVAAKIPGIEEWAKDSGAFTFEQDNGAELVSVINEIIAGGSLDAMRTENLERVKSKAIYEDNIAARVELMKQLVISK